MCTLVVAWRVFGGTPIAVAANRDEATGRRAFAPSAIDTDPTVVAPRDEEAGGTWIGYNEAGVFAAITNRWTDRDGEGERSRGLLVSDALAEKSVASAARTIEGELAALEYDFFNLLVCDGTAAILLEWDGRLQVSTLEPGLHIVMNVGYDDTFDVPDTRRESGERQVESARRVRAALQPEPGETAMAWLDRAGQLLGNHEYGVCVHGDGFGTRSSSLIALAADGHATYRFADGSPCRAEYESVEAADTWS